MVNLTNEKNDINKWLILVPTMFAAFMFSLDETIANIALPHIAGSFSVSNQESIWILTSYLIASCLTIPMLDWLCRLLGRKNLFILMVFIFTVSSFVCGISSSMPLMIVGRFFQGFGGGVLIPIAQAIMMENFKGKDLTTAITIFGLVVIVAPIIGPVLGGWITENYSWHWIFFMNIPIGALIVTMAKTMIVDPPYAQKQKNVKTDWWGLLFLIMFAVAFEIMMDKGNDEDWFNSVFICRLTVIWVIGLIGFIISQIKGKETLVRFNVLSNWNYTMGTICITVMNAILFLNKFLPEKTDVRVVASAGILLLSIGSWMLGDINLQISQASIFIPNILFGIGMTLAMIPLVSFSCLTVAPKEMSNASGLQNFIKTIGGAVGTSLVATFISRFSQIHQFMMVKNLTETNNIYLERLSAYAANFAQSTDFSTASAMGQQLLYNQLLQQARLWAYIDSFRIYAVVGLGIIFLVFLMRYAKESDS